MVRFLRTDIENVHPLRLEYLNSLPEFQDIFLEFMIPESKCYSIEMNRKMVGYTFLSHENILIEFHVEKKISGQRESIFIQALEELSVNRIYCKSFDYVLMKSCLERKLKYKTIGLLYRNLSHGTIQNLAGLQVRMAKLEDMPFLSSQNDEVFEPLELLPEFIKDERILIYSRDEDIVGCGFLTRVHPEFNYYDLGVWTSPDFRKQGIATQIIFNLKETCLERDNIPICGCEYSNMASRRTLEKCGFTSKHKLIEFRN